MKSTKARLILLCISTFAISLIFTNLSHAEVDPESVVGMWLLDEGKDATAEDSSGKENDGALMGEPEWVEGQFGTALKFDGIDDYVSFADTDDLSGGIEKKMTVVAWFNPSASGSLCPVVTKYLSAGEKDWGLLVSNTQLRFGYETGGNNWEMDTPLRGGTIALNTWYHGAFVLDGTDLKMYLDGEEVGAATLPTETPNSMAKVEIGGTSYRGDYFNGIIDEVGVLNVALTQEDIQNIMERGLESVVGGIAIEPLSRLSITWASIKSTK
ncbi:LamG domain-containing protein [Candidatus Poribacteria bacterium]